MTGGKNEKIKVKVAMSSVTVFADIGLPNAAEHSIKADLVMAIAARIKSRGLTKSKPRHCSVVSIRRFQTFARP